MKNPWKTLSSKIVYQTPFFRVRQDEVIRPNGEKGTYDVLETSGSVFILALDDEQKFPLIGQFRYPTGSYSLELPAGGRDKSSRNPLEDAKRELQEEVGLTAREWHEVGRCYAFNGLSNEEMVTFIARDLKQTPQTEQEEEGILEVRYVSFSEAFDMMKKGEINDAQCITAITQAALYMGIFN